MKLVLAGKIFKIREEIDLETIFDKTRNYRWEEEIEGGKLIKEIGKLKLESNYLEGTFFQDLPFYIKHREGMKLVIKTIEAPFLFQVDKERILLVVLEKKRMANNIANMLSKIIFISIGSITEAKISPETMRKFHESNPEDTKVIFFDGVDIPNVDKLSLYGSQLANTNLYNEYLSRGNIWYIVFKSRKFGIIAGVTRNCVVTSFSKIEPREFLEYIREEIFPLID
ncbi:MAG: hypothetical protein NZ922_06760 [Candidatus Methanomethyliaceae archaeon]|nr:hypothetical protein [Candidatus Methanomethyliaceae archaeon]MDW7971143.1 hypothetical protein [Nitrososphaerota archaeon]